MPNKTGIEYVQYTSNPIRAINLATGKQGHHCVKISPLCAHCYAESLNKRWGTGLPFTIQSEAKIKFVLAQKELDNLARLNARLHKKGETARVFLGDMTDIFQRRIPRHFLFATLDMIRELKALTLLLLTKRVDEMLEAVAAYAAKRGLSREEFHQAFRHVHMGASVGNQGEVDKFVPRLLLAPFNVLWLSVEPLLEAVNLRRIPYRGDTDYFIDPLGGRYATTEPRYGTPFCFGMSGLGTISWVVVGFESGAGARPGHRRWALDLRDQCLDARVAFFFKQWGEYADMTKALVTREGGRTTVKIDPAVKHMHVSGHVTDELPGIFRPFDWMAIKRVGKKNSGRLLDGREHSEFPKTSAEVNQA